MRRGLCFVLFLLTLPSLAQMSSRTSQDQHVLRAFDHAKSNPLVLHAFLERMPKGGDLHMHLTGAIYAETFIGDAIADHLCIDTATFSLAKNVGTTRSLPPQPVCAEGQVAAASALKNQKLYDELVDAFSMRGFVPTPGVTGHNQFFSTFERFEAIGNQHSGEWLDEVATRAARQNEQYLEIMETPDFSAAAKLGYSLGWSTSPSAEQASHSSGDESDTNPTELARLRANLLANPAFRDNVAQDRKEFADAFAARDRIERCGQPDAAPSCTVQIRFLGQVLRAFPPQQVFAQTLLYFELASTDPNVVGINFVQPEDAYMAMSEYHRQMRMLAYLHSVYPNVHISLHAGELAPGLVPPSGLRFHIREAIELGHAERIGHGVDVMYEDNPQALLKEMADHHIMVEVNITSNDVILGITKSNHPLSIYRAAHVPVALSTDDEGVSRIDITHEYERAVMDFNLGYLDLKTMARTSLEHSFLPGPSLWQQPDTFTRPVVACAAQAPGDTNPSAQCAAFLRSSEKATQQWELEHRYQLFEATVF